MAFAFGDSAAVADFGQVELLSSQEMKVTEGEFFSSAVAGYYGAGYYRARSGTRHNVYKHSSPVWRSGSRRYSF